MNASPAHDPAPVPVPPRPRLALTAEQTAAVTHGPGPQLLIAGPGSGKTRTLIARVEHLLESAQATSRSIVVVTFTNNAARECSARLEASLGAPAVRGMIICTFHALCSRILRQHAPRIGRTPQFTIYDQRAMLELVEIALADEARSAIQALLAGQTPCSAGEIRDEISLAKNRLWTPSFYEQHSHHTHARLIATVWSALDLDLADSNALDFDDLLLHAVRLLGEHPDLQLHYRARWPWILVDEVQDTCYAQMGLLRLLAQPDGNLTICGDTDQSLYSFRGAEPRNLLSFPALFPGHRTVALGRNFRSREEIVRVAENVIVYNRDRPAIELSSHRGGGGRVIVRRCENEYAEGAWIAGEIAHQIASGLAPERIMVIARAAYATAPVQRALAKAGIKCHVLGSLGLFERSDAKDALAYLALLCNGADRIALRRAVGMPRREVGDATTAALAAQAQAYEIDLLEACARAETLALPRTRARARANLARFGQQMLEARELLRAGGSVAQTVERVLMLEGGLMHHYTQVRDGADDAERRAEAEAALTHLQGIRDSAALYERQAGDDATLLGFLERAVGLHSDGPAITEDGVRISTIHGAKGTEAAVVFLCGCEEGIAPSHHALGPNTPTALEEERRAFYVGMTRAADLLVLTWAGARRGRSTAGRSRFLTEAGL